MGTSVSNVDVVVKWWAGNRWQRQGGTSGGKALIMLQIKSAVANRP